MSLKQFTFNPFAENTYVVWDSLTKIAAVIDPGMSNPAEERELTNFLDTEGLELRHLLLTHAHIDHVLGCAFIERQFGLRPIGHSRVPETLLMSERAAQMYGISYDPSPQPVQLIAQGEVFEVGSLSFEVRETPGHAPCHVVFVDHASGSVIGGDVLFNGSVGRVDLPGGDPKVLTESIMNQMYTLPDDFTVYCGHGEPTTIGKEAASNPFVRREGASRFFEGE